MWTWNPHHRPPTTQRGSATLWDGPDALFSDKLNIFDVRSTSDKVALDGTKYSEW